MANDDICYGGIDPSGSEKRISGCAIINQYGSLVKAGHTATDNEILDFFDPYNINGMGIDAPKGLPNGMGLCCLQDHPDCDCEPTPSRECEKKLIQQGLRLYPVNKNTFISAKHWIRRGLLLYLRLQNMNIECYEVYPAGLKRILFPKTDIPLPKSSVASRRILQRILSNYIYDIPTVTKQPYSDHILDAILAAYAIYLYKEKNNGNLIGNPREGQILMPVSAIE